MTHYDRLGVRPDATDHEIRAAYRRSARAAHPDRHGDASASRMAAVNEAWRVLGDADRRRRYDADLRAGAYAPPSGSGRVAGDTPSDRTPNPRMPEYHAPARFPWRFMLVMGSIGIAFVLLGVIFTDDPQPTAPDNILRSGDCVSLSVALEAAEVSCLGPYDATVQALVPFDQTCPNGTAPYRDRQGMGTACVVPVIP